MKIKEVANLLEARVVSGERYLDHEVEFAFASDLMSDVLTVEMRNIILLTGLANVQAMRTAEMSDARTVILVRNKKATSEMIALANQIDMVLLEFPGSMFKASGILFGAGIKPVY